MNQLHILIQNNLCLKEWGSLEYLVHFLIIHLLLGKRINSVNIQRKTSSVATCRCCFTTLHTQHWMWSRASLQRKKGESLWQKEPVNDTDKSRAGSQNPGQSEWACVKRRARPAGRFPEGIVGVPVPAGSLSIPSVEPRKCAVISRRQRLSPGQI